MKALKVFQLNIIQTLKFIHRTKYAINPQIFLHTFREEDHQYPTRFFQNSFYYKKSACKITSFVITLCGPTIWNSFLSQHERSIPHLLLLLKQNKFKLLNSDTGWSKKSVLFSFWSQSFPEEIFWNFFHQIELNVGRLYPSNLIEIKTLSVCLVMSAVMHLISLLMLSFKSARVWGLLS